MIYRPVWFGVLALFLCPVHAAEPASRSTEALAFNCYTCHASNLHHKSGGIPSLRGKSSERLLQKLQTFKNGGGDATLMSRIAKGYSDEELARIADYLAADLTKIGPRGK